MFDLVYVALSLQQISGWLSLANCDHNLFLITLKFWP